MFVLRRCFLVFFLPLALLLLLILSQHSIFSARAGSQDLSLEADMYGIDDPPLLASVAVASPLAVDARGIPVIYWVRTGQPFVLEYGFERNTCCRQCRLTFSVDLPGDLERVAGSLEGRSEATDDHNAVTLLASEPGVYDVVGRVRLHEGDMRAEGAVQVIAVDSWAAALTQATAVREPGRPKAEPLGPAKTIGIQRSSAPINYARVRGIVASYPHPGDGDRRCMLRGIKVELYRESTDLLVGTLYTVEPTNDPDGGIIQENLSYVDGTGYYRINNDDSGTFDFGDVYVGPDGDDFYFIVWYIFHAGGDGSSEAGTELIVIQDQDENTVGMQYGGLHFDSGEDVYMGLYPPDLDGGDTGIMDKAAHAYLDLTKAFAYIRDKGGYTPTRTVAQINWSDTTSSPHHKRSNGLIYLPRAKTDYLVFTRTHTIVHEYAHATHYRMWGDQMPPYTRCSQGCIQQSDGLGSTCPITTGASSGDCNHGGCYNDTSVDGIIEGWARFAPTAILRDNEIRWGATNGTWDLDNDRKGCTDPEADDRSEYNVGAVFYDLHQRPGHDPHVQFNHILQTLRSGATSDAWSFFQNYRALYPDQCYSVYSAFQDNVRGVGYRNNRCWMPDRPTDLSVQDTTDGLEISWNVNNPFEFDRVGVYLSRTGGDPWTYIGVEATDPPTTTFSFVYKPADTDCETTFWFRVQAERDDGRWSLPTSAVNFTTGACPDPETPTELAAKMSTPTTIQVTWQDNSTDEQYFEVSRRAQGTDAWSVVAASVAANSESWTDTSSTSLSCGTRYYYRVRARGLGSAWSDYGYSDGARTNLCRATNFFIDFYSGVTVRDLAWGDWDGDGTLDLALATISQTYVYESDGTGWSGSIQQAWTSAESESSYAVAWGDYDGDGALDLAVANLSAPDRLYHNEGGWMSLAWSTDESEATVDVVWGDVDDDGDLDLLAVNNGDPNRLYRNDGGSFTLAWTDPYVDTRSQSAAWGDYDGDGDLDLAVANAHNETNQVYENDAGTLRFDPPTGWGWESPDARWSQSVAWGDWDGDGDLDLAVANEAQANQIWENDGAGTLTLDPGNGWGWESAETDRSLDLAWGDWDGDGDLDLAVANGTTAGTSDPNDYNRVYENDGGTMFLAWTSDLHNNTFGLAWADWDGDGALDLAFANLDALSRIHESVYGPIPDVPLWQENGWGDGTRAIDWGDYDGDGDLDLAVGRGLLPGPVWTTRPDAVFENVNGTLYHNPEQGLGWTSDLVAITTDLAWADRDGDGDLDLATTDGWGNLYLYTNDGGGELTLSITVTTQLLQLLRPTLGNPGSLAWADYDGDGDLDLAHSKQGISLQVLENDGDGNLSAGWTSPHSEVVAALAWADADLDGDLDLAVANYQAPNALYRNDGGVLTRVWQDDCSTCPWTSSVAWADYDGDGDMDLAFGYIASSGVLTSPVVFENQFLESLGSSYFDPDPVWTAPNELDVTSLAWGDWDGDGDPDLAAGTDQNGPALVYENVYGYEGYSGIYGPFELYPRYGWGWMGDRDLQTNDVAWADVDGDGDLDLTLGNQYQYDLASSWRGPIQIYYATLAPQTIWHNEGLPNNRTTVRVETPDPSAAQGNGQVSALMTRRAIVPVHFWLTDPEGEPVPEVVVQYTKDGGKEPGLAGRWRDATPFGGASLTDLETSPSGTRHTFYWDTTADGWIAADSARVRVLVLQNGVKRTGPILWPAFSSTSAPFRLHRPAISHDETAAAKAGETLSFAHDIVNLSQTEGRTCYFSAESFRDWTVDFPDGSSMVLAPNASYPDGLRVEVQVPWDLSQEPDDPYDDDSAWDILGSLPFRASGVSAASVKEVIQVYATCYPGGDRSWLEYDITATPGYAVYLPVVLR